MFLINLYRFIFGYVTICAFGDFPERILNLLAKSGINVWGIKKNKDKITFSLLKRDFFKIRKLRGNSGVRIKILNKNGFNRKTRRFKLRYGLITGFALFFVIQYFLCLFIWQVEIVGNSKVEKEYILKKCAELNIRNGTLKKSVNLPVVRQELLLLLDNTAWGAINIEGCRATVNLSETKNETPDNSPSNIVADYDCIIKEIKVSKGVASVKKGEAVQKGNMLISGAVDIGDTPVFLKASGEIIGEIRESFVFEESYIIQEKKYIKQRKKRVFEIFSLKLPLYLGANNGNFDTELTYKSFKFLGADMPIGTYTRIYNEYEFRERVLTEEEVLQYINEQFSKKIEELDAMNLEILSQDISRNYSGIKITYNVKFEKKIGEHVKILN